MKIKEYEITFWDILAWIAFLWVMIYFILKALNIFQSPQIADILTILSIGYFVGKYITKLNFDVVILKKDMAELKRDIMSVKKDLVNLNHKVFPIK